MRRLSTMLSAAVACAVLVAIAVVPGTRSASAAQLRDAGTASTAPAGAHHAISWDQYSLKIDGRRVFLWGGEFDYWRLPSPDLWPDIMQKIKAAGFNTISTYFNWDYHSPAPGVYNFSGVRDVDRFLDDAKQAGLYVIARPGPYINAETDGGGFPGWLSNIKGTARTTDPGYINAVDQWLSNIDPIIARHQLTNGTGTVIGYQVENEMYGLQQSDASNRAYMADLESKARADGITVPLLGSDHGAFSSGEGAVDMEGWTDYPQGFKCSQPANWGTLPDFATERAALPATQPFYLAEFQGGAFDSWGGPGYESCRELTGPDFERVFEEAAIAAGSTMQSYYMTYGGTQWGWIPYPGVYSSYDYGAAISESRALTDKYSQQKLIGYFTQSVAPLTMTDAMTLPAPTNPAVTVTGRRNPDDGTTFVTVRPTDVTAASDLHTHIALPLGALGDYPSVPQQPGTDLELNGHDSTMLLANYQLGAQRLVYSTSGFLTSTVADGRDVAVFYGRRGQDGETVLRYAQRPQVDVLAGKVQVNWDPERHDLRLEYIHDGLARVLVHTGGRDLLLVLADDATAETFWRTETSAGPVLVRGPELVRTAALTGGGIALTGDTAAAGPLEVFAPAGVRTVSWNGRPVDVTRNASGSLSGSLAGPRAVQLPALTSWRYTYDTPEAAASYNDSGWTVANHTTSKNPHWNGTAPVLDADDYGYHHGDVWYRGHFTATGAETSTTVQAGNSGNDAFAVWLNGQYLGYATGTSPHTFQFPAGAVHAGADNVLAVLVENMAHDQDRVANDSYREPRGVQSATVAGSSAPISWRLRGDRGGEQPVDPVRGQMNNGGLHGEWAGYSLPGYPDGSWQSVTLPHAESRPGVGWYRTSFALHLPSGQDTSVGVSIGDDPGPHYRALIFVNGWLVGRYVADLGPEHTFPVPAGILRGQGRNTIAIAAWGLDTQAGLGSVRLMSLGTYASSLQVHNVNAPGYNPRLYGDG